MKHFNLGFFSRRNHHSLKNCLFKKLNELQTFARVAQLHIFYSFTNSFSKSFFLLLSHCSHCLKAIQITLNTAQIFYTYLQKV